MRKHCAVLSGVVALCVAAIPAVSEAAPCAKYIAYAVNGQSVSRISTVVQENGLKSTVKTQTGVQGLHLDITPDGEKLYITPPQSTRPGDSYIVNTKSLSVDIIPNFFGYGYEGLSKTSG